MSLVNFSEAELKALQEMARRVLGGTVNAFGRDNQPRDKTWEDHQAPEVYVAKTPSGGIPAIASGDAGTGTGGYDEPGSATCEIYCIDETDNTPDLRDIDLEQIVYNVSSTAVSGDTYVFVARDKFGHWIVTQMGDRLIWCMLAENHPGRGIPFQIRIGTWCPEEAKYRFDCGGTTYCAIDWHYDVPYPDIHAQGWFVPRLYAPTGTGTGPCDVDVQLIYVCISLDCTSDGSCENHALPCA